MDNLRENIVSVSQLADLGYEVVFGRREVIVREELSGRVIAIGQRIGGHYRVPLNDVLFTQSVFSLGSTAPDVDQLTLFHQRCGDHSTKVLREAIRSQLIQGVTLDRKYFTKKHQSKYKCLCDICARAKMTRVSFPAVRDRRLGLTPGQYMSSDILIMSSTPSREGYLYVYFVVDHASGWQFGFPMKTMEAKELLPLVTKLVEETLPSLRIVLRHMHSDGGSQLVSEVVLEFFHKHGITTSHSPRDTPEMNSVTERRVRSVKEKTMCLLFRSSLPVAFWWFAFLTALYLLNRLPTTTAEGYLTPYEMIHGVPPNLKWLRVWGCKAYALKPRSDLRKDLDDKAYSGFLVGYAEENIGYQIFVPDLNDVITTVHVVFNEVIPNPSDEYFKELERLFVKVDEKERSVDDFKFLVGTRHLDDEDGMIYETTRVVNRRGYIVAYRRLVTNQGDLIREEKVPIHAADVARMTSDLNLLNSAPASVSPLLTESVTPLQHPVLQGAPSLTLSPTRLAKGMSTVPLEGIQTQLDIGAASSSETPKRPIWNSQGRLATATKSTLRSRHPKVFKSRRSLKENLTQHMTADDKRGHRHMAGALFDSLHDACHLVVDLVCPSSYRGALSSPQAKQWKISMWEEINALGNVKKCWRVVKTPPGVKLLRGHFVYKIKLKHNKVDRFKSRFVVDGSQQEPGIDFKDTFAPVVKHTTFRIFLAICATEGLSIHQMDVKNAFINAPLTEDVYVRPHPEMKIPDGYCLKLLKSLYGLRQAPRNWNQHMHQFILSLTFIQCSEDHCVYKSVIDNHVVLLAVFVDDILIACADNDTLTYVKNKFKSRFDMTDLGLASDFLGVRIIQNSHNISIDQEANVDKLLKSGRSM